MSIHSLCGVRFGDTFIPFSATGPNALVLPVSAKWLASNPLASQAAPAFGVLPPLPIQSL